MSPRELFIYGGLRRSRLLQRRNVVVIVSLKGPVSETDFLDPGESRITANYPGLRILRRVSEEIRKRQCLEIFHG